MFAESKYIGDGVATKNQEFKQHFNQKADLEDAQRQQALFDDNMEFDNDAIDVLVEVALQTREDDRTPEPRPSQERSNILGDGFTLVEGEKRLKERVSELASKRVMEYESKGVRE